MLNSKRGAVGEILEHFPKILLTIAVMAGIFLLVGYYSKLTVNIDDVVPEVLFYRIMYSPNSISYTDNITGRVYPGIISLDNFTDETLDRAINYSYERHIAAKLELYAGDRRTLVKTTYLNKVWYERFEPLSDRPYGIDGPSGPGSVEIRTRASPVVYRESGINQPGFLVVSILTPE